MRRKIGRLVSTPFLQAAATGNAFLDFLPSPSREHLVPLLTLGALKRGKVLARPGVPVDEIHFPVRSLVSMLTRMEDGNAVEVGLAGHEGFSSVSVAFGTQSSPHESVVQIADSAYCVDAKELLKRMKDDAALHERMLAYAAYSFAASTQFAACNRLHPIEERYARWLLMAADRVGDTGMKLTREYSAQMLGVRRASVTIVASSMSKAGLIEYGRGRISVLDLSGLEALACECYGVVNAELLRLMGYSARQSVKTGLPTAFSQDGVTSKLGTAPRS
jgi:CRP-like cAMP-binding protein